MPATDPAHFHAHADVDAHAHADADAQVLPAAAALPLCPGRDGVQTCSRRAILAAGAGLVGSALIAACSTSRQSSASAHNVDAGGSPLDPAPSSAAMSVGGSASGLVTAGATSAAPTQSSSTPAGSSAATRSAASPPTHSAQPQPTHSAQPQPTHSPTPTTQPKPTPKPTTPPSPAGTVLAPLSSVPVGGSLVVDGPGGPVAIGRPSSNRVVAHTAICTHQGCTVAAAGAQLACPCHGSVYDAFTGAVIQTPAPRALSAVSVLISGSDIIAP